MDQIRIETQGARPAGFFGAREDAQLPVPSSAAGGLSGAPMRARRSWVRTALRIVRDALLAVALMATVPIGIVALQGDRFWGYTAFTSQTQARIALSDAVRPFALPKDPSITPMQAGLAFNALQPEMEVKVKGFLMIEPAVRPEATWEHAIITPDMFRQAQPTIFHGPNSQTILEAVAHGFTPQEMAYLKTLATAPVWQNFDLVARAPAVDFIGGRFKVPFGADVKSYELPILRYKGPKELAYAAVSRAAYHMALGQRDSAETILRSVMSFGLTLVDNGTSLIDELIGTVIVGTGRDALQRFYVITRDPRASSPALMPPARVAGARSFPIEKRAGAGDMRRRLIALSEDPKTRPGERYEALHMLSMSTCTNVRELMFGRRPEVTQALRAALTGLARYPSERALVELIGREPEYPRQPLSYNPITGMAVSAATVVGTVLRNPRLETCTRVVGSALGLP